jgi:hypothetical protein
MANRGFGDAFIGEFVESGAAGRVGWLVEKLDGGIVLNGIGDVFNNMQAEYDRVKPALQNNSQNARKGGADLDAARKVQERLNELMKMFEKKEEEKPKKEEPKTQPDPGSEAEGDLVALDPESNGAMCVNQNSGCFPRLMDIDAILSGQGGGSGSAVANQIQNAMNAVKSNQACDLNHICGSYGVNHPQYEKICKLWDPSPISQTRRQEQKSGGGSSGPGIGGGGQTGGVPPCCTDPVKMCSAEEQPKCGSAGGGSAVKRTPKSGQPRRNQARRRGAHHRQKPGASGGGPRCCTDPALTCAPDVICP